MTPMEAATALEGSQSPYINCILLEALPLLRDGGAVPKDFHDEKALENQQAAIDHFKKIDPQKWMEILKPDPQAVAQSLPFFQPLDAVAKTAIQESTKNSIRITVKPDPQRNEEGEMWVVYSHDLLFNPKTKEILQISKQKEAKELARKLRGKKMGSIVSAELLPEKIQVSHILVSPYIFSDNLDFKTLAYHARHLEDVSQRGLEVLYYGGEQWRVADFCVTGALILCNANAPEYSGFPEDYRIIQPDEPLEAYHFGPFVPAVVKRSTPRPSRYLTQGVHPEYRLLRQIFREEKPKKGQPPGSIFVTGSEMKILNKPRQLINVKFQLLAKGNQAFRITASKSINDDGSSYTTPTLPMLVEILKKVPDSLLAGLEKIQILDETHPKNHIATAGGGVITFYRLSVEPMDSFTRTLLTRDTLYHELGHHIAWHRFGNHSMGNHCGWLKAMQADANSPSRYAQTDWAEDFAETVQLYFSTNGGFEDDSRERHPNRFAFLDELFWDVLTPTAQRKIRVFKKRLSQS